MTLLGLGLRLHALVAEQRGIWVDEAFSIWVAQHPLPDLIRLLATVDTHPPLFYVLLHVWVIPRHDPLWVRLLPALAGSATVPVAYLLGRRASGPRFGLLCALFFALSPFLVAYSQEVRMYASGVLFSTLSLWLLIVALESSQIGSRVRSIWSWVAFVAATTALAYSFTEALFLPFAELCFLLALAGHAWWRRTSPVAALMGIAALTVVGLLWCPWLPVVLHQIKGVSNRFWIPPPDVARVTNTMLTLLAGLDLPTLASGQAGGLLQRSGAWLLLPASAVALAGVLRFPGPRRYGWLLLAAVVVPHLAALAASRYSAVYLDRSLIYTEVGLLPLLAAGVLAIGTDLACVLQAKDRWRAPRAAFGLVPAAAVGGALCALELVGLAHYYRDSTKEDWRGPARQIAEQAMPGDLVLFSGSWLQLPFDFYYRGPPLAEHGLPVDLFGRGVLEPPMQPDDVARLPALVGNTRRVWLLYGHAAFDDPHALVRPALRQLYRSEAATSYGGDITVYEYTDRPASQPDRALVDHFNGIADLNGLSLQRDGSGVVVTLFWQVTGQSPTNLKVFVHVLNPDGTVLAQRDAEPLSGTQHTTTWATGARLVDPYRIALPSPATAPVRLEVGLYDPSSGRRAPANGPDVVAGDHLLLEGP